MGRLTGVVSWGLGLIMGFILSMFSGYPGGYIDRIWSSTFSCDERFIGIVQKSVDYQNDSNWRDSDLLAFSKEVESFSQRCGRVGGYDTHQAMASIDRSLARRGGVMNEEMQKRYCFGEMITLMRVRETDWGKYLENNRDSLKICLNR